MRFKTIVTNGVTQEIFSTPGTTRTWYQLTFIKETSGTIQIGDSAELLPTNREMGVSLPNGTPVSMIVGPGSRLYAGSDTTQTAMMIIQELPPWLEAIESLKEVLRSLTGRSKTPSKGDESPCAAILKDWRG